MTTLDKLNYKDVTNDWIKNRKNYKSIKDATYYEHNGTKYYVDGKKVVLDYSEKEKEVALWLVNTFGGKIFMLPRINNPQNIETPDYLWNNARWDLKTLSKKAISKKRAIDNIIKTAKNQTDNIILDITNTNLPKNNILKQIKKIYKTTGRSWVDTIIVIKNYKLIKIFERI